jgi:hypothetical protein
VLSLRLFAAADLSRYAAQHKVPTSKMSTHSPINAALSIHTDEDFRVLECARLRALVDSDIVLAKQLHADKFHLVTNNPKN